MVIVVDTTAWVDFFRGRRSPVALVLRHLVEQNADIAITETVLMEVLAGAGPGESLAQIRADLIGRPILALEGLADFEEAARIYRTCRAAGQALRNQLDCLIAVPTIRHGASLLHNDRDFDTIARHTSLRVEPVRPPTGSDGEPQMGERAGAHTRRPRRLRARAVRGASGSDTGARSPRRSRSSRSSSRS